MNHPAPYAHAHPSPDAPATVWGVPLEPGERVLYYKRHTGIGERLFMFVIGLLFLPIVIGLLFLYWAVFYESTHERVQAITDRRFLGITGTRTLKTVIRLNEIQGIKRVSGQKNQWVVDGPGWKIMIFNRGEHNVTMLDPIMQSLANPGHLPTAACEP